jgi:hypothetical protein
MITGFIYLLTGIIIFSYIKMIFFLPVSVAALAGFLVNSPN